MMRCTTQQIGEVKCLAQTGFAVFGKGVQLISRLPYDKVLAVAFRYAEAEQLSQLNSLVNRFITKRKR